MLRGILLTKGNLAGSPSPRRGCPPGPLPLPGQFAAGAALQPGRHLPQCGGTAESGSGRCFSLAVPKAFDAAAAGCEKPGTCQHHAEGVDASHRQEGQRELIKMH